MGENVRPDPDSSRSEKRSIRFRIGVGLLVIYVLMWVAAAVVPFLPLTLTAKGTIISVGLVAAEVVGLLGLALVGKEAYQAMKDRLLGWRHRKKG